MANLYCANMNMSTAEERKSQNKATAELLVDEMYNLSQERTTNFKEALNEVNNEFAFSTMLNLIPIFHNNNKIAIETTS